VELKVLENPDPKLATEIVKSAVASRNLVLLIGECRVDYEGRGSSRLEPGERLVVIKQDGAVLVHRPTGYSPVNWQPETVVVEAAYRPGMGLMIHAVRDKPREFLTVVFSKVSLLVACRLIDSGEFTMYMDEEKMRDLLAENPPLIEEGLRVLAVEKPVGGGYVDIYALDKNGGHVLVELKRVTATREAIIQLYKYIEAYKSEYGEVPRGVIVAPAISPAALELALKLGLEYKQVDLKKLWELAKQRGTRKTTLVDFQKGALRDNGPR